MNCNGASACINYENKNESVIVGNFTRDPFTIDGWIYLFSRFFENLITNSTKFKKKINSELTSLKAPKSRTNFQTNAIQKYRFNLFAMSRSFGNYLSPVIQALYQNLSSSLKLLIHLVM